MMNEKIRIKGITFIQMLFFIMSIIIWMPFGKNMVYAAGTAPLGNGTSENPYQIASEANLIWISEQVNNNSKNFSGVYFQQKNDITLTSNWVPIGDMNYSTEFDGTYDGGGWFIKNLTINDTSGIKSCSGLFGFCNNATIKNVRLHNGQITVSKEYQQNFVGGICGYAQDTKIINCSFNGSISNKNTRTTNQGQEGFTGGILGQALYASSGGEITGCYNEGTITGSGGTIYGGPSVGGIAGIVCGITISNCYNTGSILNKDGTANDCNAGGILGHGGSADGMGWVKSSVINCYNVGSVQMTYSGSSTAYIGSIIGCDIDTGAATTGVTSADCYFLQGTVTSSGKVNATIHGTSKDNTNSGMKTPTAFANWDTAVWYFKEGQYPIMKAFMPAPSVPTGLSATAGNGQVNLTWNAAAEATSYKIYQGTVAGVYEENPVATVAETSATITGLANGTTYYFVVKSSNSIGDSARSNEVSAKPEAPSSVRITAGKGLGRADKKVAYSNVKIPFVIDSESFGKTLNAYSFDVIYDPAKVGTVTVDSFNGLAKPTIGAPKAEGSKEKVTVSWSGTFSGDLTSLYNNNKGVLFKLNFAIKPAFNSGETAVEVGTGSFTFDKGGATTDIKQNNGKILFGIYGDINCDGAITSTDTGLINKYTSGKTSAISGEVKETAADVNGDGVINSADGTEISNYISGKASTLKNLFGY